MSISIPGYDIGELFDPIQTHAVYGVCKADVSTIKQILREQEATHFRIVKSGVHGMCIVCFKTKETLL